MKKILSVILIISSIFVIFVLNKITYKKNADYGRLLKITCADSYGNGMVWREEGNRIFILSCRHILEASDTCNIVGENGESISGKVVYLSERFDLGFAEFSKDDFTEKKKSGWREPEIAREKAEEFVEGEELFIRSYDRKEQKTYIEEVEYYVEELKQGLILCSGRIEPGMSGSGLYDASDYFVGYVIGGFKENVIACIPIWRILEEWEWYMG